jgi:hypothetical protein
MSVAALLFFLAPLAAAASDGSVQIPRVVPYMNEATVATNVTAECTTLGSKFGTFLEQYATKNGATTTVVDAVDTQAPGRVLEIEITNVVSSGNAFIGHRKQVSATGKLFENGVSVGRVDFTRNSGGGFAGGYKGSCSVLGRCVKALGKDFANWLKDQPTASTPPTPAAPAD